MKTLADLKRALHVGAQVTLTGGTLDRIDSPIHGIPRYVVATQGNAVQLNADANARGGSFLTFPPARLLTYDGDTFTVHAPGKRPLTPAEQACMDSMPSRQPENAEQVATDIMTDGSRMFHMDRAHTKRHGMEHLDGFETVRGLRYDFNTRTIQDETLKGDAELIYTINK